MKNNAFDLSSKTPSGPSHPRTQKFWTQAEQTEKLRGYLEIPKEYWDQIKYGSHVRYFTTADGFRPGGFVLKNPLDAKPKNSNEETRYIKLQNGFNDKAMGYAQWVVEYDHITHIYMKPDASVAVMMSTLEQSVVGLNENIRKLADRIKKMESRISALESH